MSLRISSALASLVLLAGCGSESPPPPGDGIDCAVGAGADFSPVCTLERVAGTDEIILHHPDGGFRRLIRDPATGTLDAGDGADPLVPTTGAAGTLEFALGADRYRIPQTLLEPAAP
jgi:hypothetical protein